MLSFDLLLKLLAKSDFVIGHQFVACKSHLLGELAQLAHIDEARFEFRIAFRYTIINNFLQFCDD